MHPPAASVALQCPGTVQLLEDLADLNSEVLSIARRLDFDLDLEEFCSTPYGTPLQHFPGVAEPATACSTSLAGHRLVPFDAASSHLAEQSLPDCDTGFDFSDMSGLHVAVLGTGSNRWNGAQGAAYRRAVPIVQEQIAAATRARGGFMPCPEQLQIVKNWIDPCCGAVPWYEKMYKVMLGEITGAHQNRFPSAYLTGEVEKAALGHLSSNPDYVAALRESVAAAVSTDDHLTAGDYVPSRSSGTLMPYRAPAAAAATLTPAQETELAALGDDLAVQLRYSQKLRVEFSDLEKKEAALATSVEQLRARVAAAQPGGQGSSSSASSEITPADGAPLSREGGDGETAKVQEKPQVKPPKQGSEGQGLARMQAELQAMEDDLTAARKALDDNDKKRIRVLNSANSIRLAMKELQQLTQPPAAAPADVVKAFVHSKTGKLCTAHDCVLLKFFAIMDIVYGIADPAQQIKFSMLEQGKGAGVSPDESVREFAARVSLHLSTSLNMDPRLAHVQFFAGLSNRDVAAEAERTLRADGGANLTLETAAEKVLLLEHRHMEDLRLRAANGDAKASEEIRRLVKAQTKKGNSSKGTDQPKSEDKPAKRVFHSDPNHPDGQCKLPGHEKGKGHSNKECRQGGSAYTQHAAAAVAAAIPSYDSYAARSAQGYSGYAFPVQDGSAQAAYFAALGQQLANAVSMSMRNQGVTAQLPTQPSPPTRPSPTAHGQKCNICNYPTGHATGFCYYEHPDRSPNWRPAATAPAHLIERWRARRQQLRMPPLEPRRPMAGTLMLGAPNPVPMLPAPPAADDGNPYGHGSTGRIITMPAIAQLDIFHPCFAEHFLAALPRSFLQYPAGAYPANQLPPALAAEVQSRAGASNEGPPAAGQQAGESSSWEEGPEDQEEAIVYSSPLSNRVRFVDEADQRAAIQAPTPREVAAMLAELQHSADFVPCLDTFTNMTAAAGVSIQLPDGRWQLPDAMITDSGATFGVAFQNSARDISLRYSPASVTLVLADGKKIEILGISDPVRLVFARGTEHERAITYRFIMLPGEGKYYKWLVAKNALLEVGGYVDPAASVFCYRTRAGLDSPVHTLPVRCRVPAADAEIGDCLHMLQPEVVAAIPSLAQPAAAVAGSMFV